MARVYKVIQILSTNYFFELSCLLGRQSTQLAIPQSFLLWLYLRQGLMFLLYFLCSWYNGCVPLHTAFLLIFAETGLEP
jgi:hypothetical protein